MPVVDIVQQLLPMLIRRELSSRRSFPPVSAVTLISVDENVSRRYYTAPMTLHKNALFGKEPGREKEEEMDGMRQTTLHDNGHYFRYDKGSELKLVSSCSQINYLHSDMSTMVHAEFRPEIPFVRFL